MPVFQLTDKIIFPPPEMAEENGLLAIGGDLSAERLLLAYSNGIFPWYSEGEPILWWSPSPRLVIFPDEFKMPKRLSRLMRQKTFSITMDSAFRQVITSCANVDQRREKGTWITQDMVEAYCLLHELGFAHSVECRQNKKLVGGLYGVSLGGIFFGESMFSSAPNSSKIALASLVKKLLEKDFDIIDCQMKTEHLIQFGAREIPGTEFQKLLAKSMSSSIQSGKWQID